MEGLSQAMLGGLLFAAAGPCDSRFVKRSTWPANWPASLICTAALVLVAAALALCRRGIQPLGRRRNNCHGPQEACHIFRPAKAFRGPNADLSNLCLLGARLAPIIYWADERSANGLCKQERTRI